MEKILPLIILKNQPTKKVRAPRGLSAPILLIY
jgi:hypothetical protein